MNSFLLHYIESNVLCLVVFGIMLTNNLLRMDKQEKQIRLNNVIIAFMLYFTSDIIWASIQQGLIKANLFFVCLINLSNFILMSIITYTWLNYAMVAKQASTRRKKTTNLIIAFPLMISILVFIILLIINPYIFINNELQLQLPYYIFFIVVPLIYIVSSIIYSLKQAGQETRKKKKRTYIFIGLFPLVVIFGGLIQTFVIHDSAMFCLSCTIFMLVFYIQSMESQISIDPLTGLNNRGQLDRYINLNSHRESLKTFVIMIDINDFKLINDTFGHAEGDRALIILANSLKDVTENRNIPLFLGRYGGDEFILITHSYDEEEVKQLTQDIRVTLKNACINASVDYILAVGIGYDELIDNNDSYEKCIERADHKLYINKDICKVNGETTLINKEE